MIAYGRLNTDLGRLTNKHLELATNFFAWSACLQTTPLDCGELDEMGKWRLLIGRNAKYAQS